MSSCAMAPSTPITIVSPAMSRMAVDGPSSGKSSVWVRTMAYTPTFVSRPAKMAVTGVTAVGYESGSQKNSGKMAALIPKTMKKNQPSADRTPGSTASSRTDRSARFTVPVAA